MVNKNDYGMFILSHSPLNEYILTCVAYSARISCGAAVTKELGRTLSARGAVFAWIRIAPIDCQTRIENDFILATILVLLPISRQPIVTIDRNQSHATNESILGFTASDQVDAARDHAEQSCGSHRSLIDVQHQLVLGDGQHQRMPATIVELVIVVVESCFVVVGLNLHFDFSIFQVNLYVSLGREFVVQHEATFLVSAKQKGDVHLLYAFVTFEFGEGAFSDEGDRRDWWILVMYL